MPVGNPLAIRTHAASLAANSCRRLAQVRAAQRKIVEGGLNSRSYAMRNRELTFSLLGRPGGRAKRADSNALVSDRGTGI